MIIDMRTYTYKPDKYREFLKIYREHGYAITSEYLGKHIGLFTASSGTVNKTIQLFAYDDHDHRDRCRENFLTSSKKQNFTNGSFDADSCIREQNSQIIVPADFSPIRDYADDNPIWRDKDCSKRIFEFNTYFCKPGKRTSALAFIKTQLFPLAGKYVPWVLGYFINDSGSEKVFELRAFASLQERMAVNNRISDSEDGQRVMEQYEQFFLTTDSTVWEAMPMSMLQ